MTDQPHTETPTRFVSRYFVGQEANGDPIIDQVLWEQTGDAEPVAVMVRGKVTPEQWADVTRHLLPQTP